MSDGTIVKAKGLGKRFGHGDLAVDVFRDIDLTIAKGERIAIIGSSGAGKSTLLHLLGGLDQPSSGEVWVAGERMSDLSQRARGRLRNRVLGFVYQFHHLLPEFTVLENVAMPLLIRGTDEREANDRARKLLTEVGLQARLRHKPGELSGGERQRAAVARALVGRPACIMADEPTGNLDHRNAGDVFDLMMSLNAEQGSSLVIVTHERSLAEQMDRILVLENGRLIEG
ncbi:MAG: lipoprotein-releasing ABC transporter ATP-binding protein LolD [Gammaproteobacteria bacterium]|nr:lipoprotein-releasing ABC transporter ATP-binding protein LolD [Gammaproteobacteria bacterium]